MRQGLNPSARGRLLYELAVLVEENADELAMSEKLDNGKPLSESTYLDVSITAEVWRYCAGWSPKLAGQILPVSPAVGATFTYTRREPLDVIGLIVPSS